MNSHCNTLSHHHLFLWKTLASLKMSGKKAAILALHCARKSDSAIAKTLSITRSTAWKTLKRFKEKRDLSDHPRCGRPRFQQSKSMIKCIQKGIRRNQRRFMRLLAKTANMSPRSMRRLVHEDLKMSSFTLQKRQTLSGAVKQKRLERSKVLLEDFRSHMASEIVCSDEKIEMANN